MNNPPPRDILPRSSDPEEPTPPPPPPSIWERLRQPQVLVAGGGIVAMLFLTVCLGGLALRGLASPPAEPTPLADAPGPTAVPCDDAGDRLAVVDELLSQGKDSEAADSLATILVLPNLCPAMKPIIQERFLDTGYAAVFEEFTPRDIAAEGRVVATFEELRDRAIQLGVSLQPDVGMAEDAYDRGAYALTQIILQEAYRRGLWDPTTQREVASLYRSSLYNQGELRYAAESEDSALYNEGMRMLVTAHLLTRQWDLGSSEALEILRRELGENEDAWPDPYPDIFLPE